MAQTDQNKSEWRCCPFCRHDGEGIQMAMGENGYQVACLACGTHGPVGKNWHEATRMWNTPIRDYG